MKIKKDWWLVNSIAMILLGLLFIFTKASEGMLTAGLFIGGLNILVGVALLQRSKVAFWITLITFAASLLSGLNTISKNSGNYLPVILDGLYFAFVLMLWQQIRKEEKKK